MNRNHPFHDLLKPFGIRIDLHGKPVHDPCDQSVDKAHVLILLKKSIILQLPAQTYMAAVINSGHISLVVRLIGWLSVLRWCRSISIVSRPNCISSINEGSFIVHWLRLFLENSSQCEGAVCV